MEFDSAQRLNNKNEEDDSGIRKKHVTTMLTDILNTSSIMSAPDAYNSTLELNDIVKKEKFSNTSLLTTSETVTYKIYPYKDCSGEKHMLF